MLRARFLHLKYNMPGLGIEPRSLACQAGMLTTTLHVSLYQCMFFAFSTLVPKANLWIQNNMNIRLVRCETIEKKVCSIEDVTTDEVMFVPKGSYAIYVKGLRYVVVVVLPRLQYSLK